MAWITLKDIRKSFGETEVLKGVDLDIADGEFLTLVGPSGCGKSTLLRIIAGLETQSGGDVIIGGANMNATRPSERDLAMVFQSYALYPHLTVRQNIQTPLRLRDLGFWERAPLIGAAMPGRRDKMTALNAHVDDVAQVLKIAHLMDRKPGQLSGGQRQRVALGRAMVRKPVAFLMDEPLSNLDAALRVHMRAELAQLHRSLATTFVYVTHDQAEALTMSDRMAVMMDGEILQLGAPDEIYRNPRDQRVAEFIGSPRINMLTGTVADDGAVSIHGIPLRHKVPATHRDIRIGVRPEHLILSSVATDRDGWALTVTHKENLGSDFFLHGHVNGGSEPMVARAHPDQVSSVSIGDQVFLQAQAGAFLAFDADARRLDMVGV